MMKKILVLLLATLFSQFLFAQQSFIEKEEESTSLPEIIQNLDQDQDPRLNNMINWHIENNLRKNGADGFRVEIYTSAASDAFEKSLQAKKEFLLIHPDINVHIKYNAPDFKVRVGDFRTKNEALALQKKILYKYPKSFIVPDVIKFPELKGSEQRKSIKK